AKVFPLSILEDWELIAWKKSNFFAVFMLLKILAVYAVVFIPVAPLFPLCCLWGCVYKVAKVSGCL
ncbi:hypothetical protein, partial [Bartonella sp. MM73XJBT]|uniref:hypothetical protein n=1 Tax=Bartonella sp. MM73XJBT TaxID=3019095 RepID=UPI002361A7CA